MFSTIDGYLGGFKILAMVNSTDRNIHVQVVEWVCVFISLGFIPKIEFLGHTVGICSALVDTAKPFYKVFVLIYTQSVVFPFRFQILINAEVILWLVPDSNMIFIASFLASYF